MLVHIGQNTTVLSRDVIAIFDYRRSSEVKETREYLRLAANNGSVVKLTEEGEEPKSFVVTDHAVYLSPVSTLTLQRRLVRRIGTGKNGHPEKADSPDSHLS